MARTSLRDEGVMEWSTTAVGISVTISGLYISVYVMG